MDFSDLMELVDEAVIAGYISDWYESQGYETQVQVFEYDAGAKCLN